MEMSVVDPLAEGLLIFTVGANIIGIAVFVIVLRIAKKAKAEHRGRR